MTGPICASNGLIVHMDEDEVQEFERQGKYGPTHWLRFRYQITVYHVSGERLPTARRSVEVIRTGAQSSGSAQSYALKQFLRALFQIPTGDADEADASAFAAAISHKEHTGAINPAQAASEGIKDAWRNGVLDSLPQDATDAQKANAFAAAIIADFKGKGVKALDNAWERHVKYITAFEVKYPELFHQISEAYDARRTELDADVPVKVHA
jgi:hypothetical protein